QVDVVADREDRAARHELILLPRVGLGDDQRRLARVDQRGLLRGVVGVRYDGRVEADVGHLLEIGEEQPVRLVRVGRVAQDHDREGQRLGGLELGTDVVVAHGAGRVLAAGAGTAGGGRAAAASGDGGGTHGGTRAGDELSSGWLVHVKGAPNYPLTAPSMTPETK